ncbi:RNA polymerase sigma factor [Rhodopirellula sp. MGV]|uniref:RNA polymerase sigma factor n=1 Tax=Rhodopirellula sp. MGV TaxID=2023130 RepID=UPI000B96197A|nr:sigma-70 family RNA polymerase sigma factor [Rhodopirellula sp. MGV]OYP28237.1 hypothetical protein CGZ80_27345 [Rhodopirellula sp. MGV]PNY34239.1 sigma-70 family RNA polymerase sigma factor [Rhodopirellula baltica]
MNASSKHDRRSLFHSICDENRLRLSRIARFYGRSDADDLLQDILLQLWCSLPKFQHQCSTGTWCFRVAINTAITWQRARRTKVTTINIEMPATLATNTASDTHQQQMLERFLDSLPEIDRATLIMHLENFSHAEIAETMGVGQGAIRTRLCRIRKRLKQWEQD